MRGYVLQRIVALVPVLLVVAVVIFSVVRLAPGDPAAVILGEQATAEQVAELRHRMGLDEPIPMQFLRWVGNAAHGDLGESLFFGQPVTQTIVERIEPTLLLTVYALVFAVVLGLPWGMLAALKRHTVADRLLMGSSLFGIAAPNFLIGLLLIWLIAIRLQWSPSGGYQPVSEGLIINLKSLALPAIALGLSQFALVARMTRTAVLEVLGADFIRVAYAKGVPYRFVVFRHILRNALMPIVTIIGLSFAALMGGTVVIETLFDLPGVGRLVVQAVLRRDYPVIQGAVLYITVAVVVVNLLIDLLYAWIDPRIQY